MSELQQIANELRGIAIELSFKGRTPHLGSSLSCADIIAALYWEILDINPQNPEEPQQDRFILSKGHAVTTLYAALAKKGYFPVEELSTYVEADSRLPEHPIPGCIPGIDLATGSLGHGLSVAVGMALANRIQKLDNRVFTLLSDGECNEGSIWEAAMFAPTHKLGNLCAIVDFNKWQATGRSQEVMSLEPLEKKFESFGWNTYRIDGHSFDELLSALRKCESSQETPTAIIADTVKGKGVSFMEDDNNWHYRIPTKEEVELAKRELGLITLNS